MTIRFRLIQSSALAAMLAACAFFAFDLNAKEPVRHWDFQTSKLDKEGIPEGWDSFIQYLHDLSLVEPELGGVGGDVRVVEPTLGGAGFFLGIAVPGSKIG